ncbi:U-box domain-containing protein [Musa troglodytarum]|uniref:U-box domain-containing protein n=1 Tax=Musa troglodytarum TaxID=320322 RepID=A0A9E7HRG4_9LILI|nr:U-box domain-containing protein [Musa troglodytarum]
MGFPFQMVHRVPGCQQLEVGFLKMSSHQRQFLWLYKLLQIEMRQESGIREELRENDAESLDNHYHNCGLDVFEKYQSLLSALHEAESAQKQFRIVERIRNLLKEDEEARIFMGTNGAVEVLIQFLRMAVHNGDEKAQEAGAMALFNLMEQGNDDSSRTDTVAGADVLKFRNAQVCSCPVPQPVLSRRSQASYWLSMTVPFLIQLLRDHNIERSSCKYDALYTLYNLSTHTPNIPSLVSSDIINSLHPFLGFPSASEGVMLAEKALAILINLAASQAGRKEITSAPSVFCGLAGVLDFGEPAEQEQVVSFLLILCSGDERCSQMVLQEGVIPSLISISVNGTTKGKEKAEKLLKLFREQRQREPSPLKQQPQQVEKNGGRDTIIESKTLCKSRSKKFRWTLSSIWKNTSFSIHREKIGDSSSPGNLLGIMNRTSSKIISSNFCHQLLFSASSSLVRKLQEKKKNDRNAIRNLNLLSLFTVSTSTISRADDDYIETPSLIVLSTRMKAWTRTKQPTSQSQRKASFVITIATARRRCSSHTVHGRKMLRGEAAVVREQQRRPAAPHCFDHHQHHVNQPHGGDPRHETRLLRRTPHEHEEREAGEKGQVIQSQFQTDGEEGGVRG